jgi:hypothetical protein
VLVVASYGKARALVSTRPPCGRPKCLIAFGQPLGHLSINFLHPKTAKLSAVLKGENFTQTIAQKQLERGLADNIR